MENHPDPVRSGSNGEREHTHASRSGGLSGLEPRPCSMQPDRLDELMVNAGLGVLPRSTPGRRR